MIVRKLPLFSAFQVADLPTGAVQRGPRCIAAAVVGVPCVGGQKPLAADFAFLRCNKKFFAETSKGPVRANVECGEITITDAVAADDYEPDYDGVRIEKLEVELSEIPQVLKDLGIIPDKRAEEEGKTYVYFDATEGEYMPFRGSAFYFTSNSGPSALNLSSPRSDSYDGIGFRSAFYEVNGKLITE